MHTPPIKQRTATWTCTCLGDTQSLPLRSTYMHKDLFKESETETHDPDTVRKRKEARAPWEKHNAWKPDKRGAGAE
eukprot:15466074-Alexandrium_andersonii.AAC.1